MHRSASTSRASEEFFIHSSSPSSKTSPNLRTIDNELPIYDPLSDMGKKERLRIKFAENAVHVIPLVLVLCAITLWFFSNTDVEMVNKDNSILERIEGLTIDGDIDVHDSGTGLLSSLDLDDLDSPKKVADQKAGKSFKR